MPQGIVDALEVVQVYEQQPQHLVVAMRQPQQQVQLFSEQAPVRQRRQAVVIRHLSQPVLGLGHFLDGLVQLLVASGELGGPLLHLHAQQLMIDVHARLVGTQPADNTIENGGDFLDFAAALNLHRLGQAARGDLVSHPRQACERRGKTARKRQRDIARQQHQQRAHQQGGRHHGQGAGEQGQPADRNVQVADHEQAGDLLGPQDAGGKIRLGVPRHQRVDHREYGYGQVAEVILPYQQAQGAHGDRLVLAVQDKVAALGGTGSAPQRIQWRRVIGEVTRGAAIGEQLARDIVYRDVGYARGVKQLAQYRGNALPVLVIDIQLQTRIFRHQRRYPLQNQVLGVAVLPHGGKSAHQHGQHQGDANDQSIDAPGDGHDRGPGSYAVASISSLRTVLMRVASDCDKLLLPAARAALLCDRRNPLLILFFSCFSAVRVQNYHDREWRCNDRPDASSLYCKNAGTPGFKAGKV